MKPAVRNTQHAQQTQQTTQLQPRRRQQGLTLLELMVVLAIIGILATVGATQFQNYIARSRVTAGLTLAAPYKLAVEEQLSAGNGTFTEAQLGAPAFTATDDVTAITVTPMTARGVGGRITITFGERVGGGGTLTLTPYVGGSSVEWVCAAAGVIAPPAREGVTANGNFEAGNLPVRFAPANCRG